ncbi:MAG: ABC transporter permease [Acidimicrobiales bacterium]
MGRWHHPPRSARLPDPVVVTALMDRWSGLGSRVRVALAIAAVVGVYLLALAVTGWSHGIVYRKAPLGVVTLGVVFGSVTALGAMGLILVYRANRFINFAHGALGSMVGVLGICMVKAHGVPYFVALPLAVVVGAAVGAFLEFAVIRRFKNSARLIVTVASIGLAQLLGGFELLGSKAIKFTSLTGSFAPPINVHFSLDNTHIFGGDEVLIVLVVPGVIAALAYFLLRTHAGVAVRAAAENSDRALLLGIPVRRLSTMVWLFAGALTTLTFMLQAPFEGIKPGLASNGPSVLLPALAVAVIARMESLPVAFGAGIGLGITEQLVYWNTPKKSTIYLVYLIVIIAALLLQRGKLSRAEEGASSSWSAAAILKPIPEELRKLPEVLWLRRGLLLAIAVAAVVVPHGWSVSHQLLAGFALVWGLIGISLVILTGWGGHISLGQFGIAGVSGMVAGNLISHWNVDFFFVILAAGAAGAVVALLIGLPALRIRGPFLAVTTLAVALALDQYFLNQNNFKQFIPSDRIGRPLLLRRFDLNNFYEMYLCCLVFVVLAILVTQGLRKSRSGRVLIGTRDNQRAADAAGVPTTSTKLGGFLLAGIIAGIAGALDILLLQALNPGNFPAIDSITAFSYTVIGGLGSVTGALVGVLSFKFLETQTWLGSARLAINGAMLLIVLYFLPGGIGQLLFRLRDSYLRLIADRRGILVPSLVADKREEDEEDVAPDETGLLTAALAEPAPGDEREPVGAGAER